MDVPQVLGIEYKGAEAMGTALNMHPIPDPPGQHVTRTIINAPTRLAYWNDGMTPLEYLRNKADEIVHTAGGSAVILAGLGVSYPVIRDGDTLVIVPVNYQARDPSVTLELATSKADDWCYREVITAWERDEAENHGL